MATVSIPQHRLPELHARFLALLPRIQLHGRIFFRQIRCSQKKADALQEMQALAWKWYARLILRGKDPSQFLGTFNNYLARAVHNGRRLVGIEKPKDVLSPLAQKLKGFKIESLPTSSSISYERLYSIPHGQELHHAVEDHLRDNTITPIPDQAAFRIDWPRWVKSRSDRDQRIIHDLMGGERTLDVSQKYGLSPARISQLRQQLHQDWLAFNDENSKTDKYLAAA